MMLRKRRVGINNSFLSYSLRYFYNILCISEIFFLFITLINIRGRLEGWCPEEIRFELRLFTELLIWTGNSVQSSPLQPFCLNRPLCFGKMGRRPGKISALCTETQMLLKMNSDPLVGLFYVLLTLFQWAGIWRNSKHHYRLLRF